MEHRSGVRVQPEAVDRRVREVIAAILCVDTSALGPEASLVDDLGVDSLFFLSLVTSLEREFNVRLPDAEAARLRTVGQVTAAVQRLVTAGTRSVA